MAAEISETTVLFIWEVRDQLQQYLINNLQDLKDQVKLIFPSSSSEEELLKLTPSVDMMVGWRPTRKLLMTTNNLKLFFNPGAGVQHLVELFREVNQTNNVLLANGHGNSYFTAQHAVAMLLTLMNKIIPLFHNLYDL
ncbi:MAG: hypothetical protein ACXADA_09345 [Candidatus Hodarchaeales archaeon]|jgi:phosphoglycerate dehydrogenase-like enzyme